MAYLNGRLPADALAAIPGGHLRKDAAAAWNAMNAESIRRFGIHLHPLGPASSYRTLSQQDYLWDHVEHPHDTNWVAEPGTSNHGWGLAVDLATRQMRWVIDQIGVKYGWAKKWSDAPGEWWHIKWRPGVWHPTVHHVDKLAVLTKQEKFLVTRLAYHRAQMVKEAKTGRGPKYQANRKWANYYKAQIKKQMAAIVAAYHKHRDWSVLHRGVRYQLLRKSYLNQL